MEVEIPIFDNAENLLSVRAGQKIFETGDAPMYMYVVVEGEVDLFVQDLLVETVKARGIFGEMALIEKAPRVATAVARTDCKLAEMDEELFNFMVQQTPFVALQVMRVLAERLRRMDMRVSGA